MAMLEGHKLEKELLSVVSILSLVGFPQKTFLLAELTLGKCATNLQSR